jgi:hypothetical protein
MIKLIIFLVIIAIAVLLMGIGLIKILIEDHNYHKPIEHKEFRINYTNKN